MVVDSGVEHNAAEVNTHVSLCRFSCYLTPSDRSSRRFFLAQLHHYTLEPDPELPLDAPAQRERLVLAFSTGDVVFFGVWLASLLDHLRDQKLAAVWPLAERYANLEPAQPCVTGITVRMLDNKHGK